MNTFIQMEMPKRKKDDEIETLLSEKVYARNFADGYWKGPYTLSRYEKNLAMPFVVKTEQGEMFFKHINHPYCSF